MLWLFLLLFLFEKSISKALFSESEMSLLWFLFIAEVVWKASWAHGMRGPFIIGAVCLDSSSIILLFKYTYINHWLRPSYTIRCLWILYFHVYFHQRRLQTVIYQRRWVGWLWFKDGLWRLWWFVDWVSTLQKSGLFVLWDYLLFPTFNVMFGWLRLHG